MSFSYDAGTTAPTYGGLAEFGGARINDGTFKTHHLGGIQDGAPIRESVTPLPNDSGGFAGAAFLNPRDISLEGWLKTASPDDVFAAMDYLRAAFALGDGSLQTLVVKQRGWTTRRQLLARLAGPVTFVEPDIQHKKVPTRDFLIPMVAPDPLLYDADNQKTIDLPLDGTAHAVTNAGTVDTPMVVRFTGPFTGSATLTSAASGKLITYQANITAGNYADLQTNPAVGISAISNVGGNIYQWVGAWTLFTIPPGTSNFSATAVGGTTGASKVTLTWRDAWA